MTAPERTPPAAARADRMLLWYPASWRARYGEEFAELLIAERAEQPRSWRRTANVAFSGLRARLAGAGLAGHPLDQAAAARAGLATLACSVAAFAMFGAAMWSQLAIGMQWSVAGDHGITHAMDLMSAALLLLAVLAVAAAVPLVRAAILTWRQDQARTLLRPALLVGAGALVLLVGGRHFENGWPGTGGHLLVHQGLVPGGVAAFCWAITMWITSYWVHPAMLAAFPVTELAWMALSPAAIGCVITGAAQLVRRLDLSPRGLRYQAWLGRVAAAGMVAFLSGVLCWLGAAGGARPLFHVGVIDRAGLAVLAIAVVAGTTAARRAGVAGHAVAGQARGGKVPADPTARSAGNGAPGR